MIQTSFLDSEKHLPFVIERQAARAETKLPANRAFAFLLDWYADNRAYVEESLHQYGAILFRGFGVNTAARLEQFVQFASGEMMDYVDGNSPRTKVQAGVYTSTEYPAQYFISLHNEMSYSDQWPRWQFFCCVIAAEEGGQTPLADSRALLQNLSPRTVEAFKQKQVKYIRNLNNGGGLGKSWQETFETTNKDDVMAICRATGTQYQWMEGDALRISNVRPATLTHPETGEEVWFNQADQFHPSTHPKAIYDSLMMLYQGREENMPQNATFGDNTPIPLEMLEEIRQVTKQQMVLVPWQEGDLVLVDNMLVSHGRMPFKGQRKILVAMSPLARDTGEL